MGENTFGKGSVQVVIPIDSEEALRLTTARYYLPSGRTIQAVGVVPDIIVHPGPVPRENSEALNIKESDLKMHLENELNKADDKHSEQMVSKKPDNKEIITDKMIYEDIQLKSAIDSLKVLNTINNKQEVNIANR